jgi:hypothetical protein
MHRLIAISVSSFAKPFLNFFLANTKNFNYRKQKVLTYFLIFLNLNSASSFNSYRYIKAAKSFFNVPREKSSPRPLAAEAAQSR